MVAIFKLNFSKMFCEVNSVVPSLKSVYYVVININDCFDKTQTNGKPSEEMPL